MNKKFIATLFVVGLAWTAVQAAPRTLSQRKAIAAKALAGQGITPRRQMAQTNGQAPSDDLTELRQLEACSVIGYEGGSFAVVSADDSAPDVLGVCTTGLSGGQNPEFEWWLQAVNEALANRPKNAPRRTTTPDPDKYPVQVGPLVTTHWGQSEPYFNLCPVDTTGERSLTGCVATAMAQVINYHKMPLRGQGEATIYYPQYDVNGTPVYAHFGDTHYDWANMRDDYLDQPYTEAEAQAVAELMMHCGVVADMKYSSQGSGASGAVAAPRMARFFGFDDAVYYKRDDYSEEDWMDMVYEQISQRGPILYGGADGDFGHAFVLHGYREDGFVYVNWGWEGNSDGYYNIALLNPQNRRFTSGQGMVFGIKGNDNRRRVDYTPATFDVATPGTLSDQFTSINRPYDLMADVTITGQLDNADLATLHDLTTEGQVMSLDLSGASFVGGGASAAKATAPAYTAEAGELPAGLFKGSQWLTDVRLPEGIKAIGNAAFSDCPALRSVEIPASDDAQFVKDGHVIYTADGTEVINILASASGHVKVNPTATVIRELAAAGCIGIDSLELPATVTALGNEALRDCRGLMFLRVRSKEAPTLQGYDTFKGINFVECTLNVPSGSKSKYTRKAQWKEFVNVTEFGTTITANNVTRNWGEENPVFGYKISGSPVSGTPELYTDATPTSPAGVYTIYVLPGTITDPEVEYVNGKLIVIGGPVTGITETEADAAPSATYDLQGRRVNTSGNLRQGMYIIGGKKHIVR